MALMMKDLSPTEIFYTHFDPTEGQVTLAIGRLVELARRTCEVFSVPVEPEFALYCLKHRGIEVHRLMRLGPEQLSEPMLFLHWGDTHLLADGNHRYVKHAQLGAKWASAWVMDEVSWRPYVVQDAPQEDAGTVINSFSGIF